MLCRFFFALLKYSEISPFIQVQVYLIKMNVYQFVTIERRRVNKFTESRDRSSPLNKSMKIKTRVIGQMDRLLKGFIRLFITRFESQELF